MKFTRQLVFRNKCSSSPREENRVLKKNNYKSELKQGIKTHLCISHEYQYFLILKFIFVFRMREDFCRVEKCHFFKNKKRFPFNLKILRSWCFINFRIISSNFQEFLTKNHISNYLNDHINCL